MSSENTNRVTVRPRMARPSPRGDPLSAPDSRLRISDQVQSACKRDDRFETLDFAPQDPATRGGQLEIPAASLVFVDTLFDLSAQEPLFFQSLNGDIQRSRTELDSAIGAPFHFQLDSVSVAGFFGHGEQHMDFHGSELSRHRHVRIIYR